MPEEQPTIVIPARSIPVPVHISEEAQGVLAMASPSSGLAPWPEDLTDRDAVAATIAARDAPAADAPGILAAGTFGAALQEVADVAVEHRMFGDISVYVATPATVSDDDPRLFIVFHGAWVSGGGVISQIGAQLTAKALGVRTWAVDYRMPPYHPYPTPLDDCIGAYREALGAYKAENIAIGGTSGGGNLTLATLLRARDEGLPMPAAAAINTPYADMTHSGDSHHTNYGVDLGYDAGDLENVRDVYLDGHDPLDPLVSPVLGDYTGFPPAILSTGTRDFLLSETIRVHRKLRALGIEADLHVWEAAPHFMFLGMSPEDHERNAEIRTFLDRHWGTAAPASAAVLAASTPAPAAEDDASAAARQAIIGAWDVTQIVGGKARKSLMTFRQEDGSILAEAPADEYGSVSGDVTTTGNEVRWVTTIRKPFKMAIHTRVAVTGDTFEGEAKAKIGPATKLTGVRRV